MHERNDYAVRALVKQGIIGNFLYVSSKNGQGIEELCSAIFDSNIKQGAALIEPSEGMSPEKVKKKKTKKEKVFPAPVPPAIVHMHKTGFNFSRNKSNLLSTPDKADKQ